jgi:hypothetical protein
MLETKWKLKTQINKSNVCLMTLDKNFLEVKLIYILWRITIFTNFNCYVTFNTDRPIAGRTLHRYTGSHVSDCTLSYLRSP